MVTPAMAQRFLKGAFKCTYDDCCTELLAQSIIERMNLILENMIAGNLEHAEIWRLFETDKDIAFIEEAFACNPPGFAMMMSIPWLKKKLFKQLHPYTAHGGSVDESILDQMDVIIDHMSG